MSISINKVLFSFSFFQNFSRVAHPPFEEGKIAVEVLGEGECLAKGEVYNAIRKFCKRNFKKTSIKLPISCVAIPRFISPIILLNCKSAFEIFWASVDGRRNMRCKENSVLLRGDLKSSENVSFF